MRTDIVFPFGNEEKLMEMGKRLGFERLIFVYEKMDEVKKIDSKIKINYGILVKEKNKGKLIKKINQIKKKGFLILVQAADDDFNRFVLEKTRADIIFGLELVHNKDAMHYRRSGLDQVLCKIAAEKCKIVGFSFKEVFDPRCLGRVIQNLRFCKKYKIKFLLGSFANFPEEMKSEHDLKLFVELLQQKFL